MDVFNNYAEVLAAKYFTSLWGVGIESAIYAEKNAIDLANGTPTDLLAVYNASVSTADQLTDNVGWVPTLRLHVDEVSEVKAIVTSQAGAGIIDSTLP